MISCDTVLIHARIVDVFRLRIFSGWIGIKEGRFLYVEEGGPPGPVPAVETRDMAEAYIVPGLIDAHMHIESSLLTPRRFAEAVVPHGTTTVLADPHEIANAAGEDGLRRMIEASRGLPLDVKIALPSCVPATSADLEWTAEVFGAGVVERFSALPEVLALGEVMDYRRLLSEAETPGELRGMISAAEKSGLLLEGHVPTLRGTELSEYLYPGIGSDHTLTTPDKMREQLSKGLAVMLQAKSLTREVVEAVNALSDKGRVILVTDDVEPSVLIQGHLSLIVKRAMQAGMDPVEALAAATIRPSRYLGLDKAGEKRGGIAPGWRADFLVLDRIDSFPPREVHVEGRTVAREGKLSAGRFSGMGPWDAPPGRLPGPFREEDFRIAGPRTLKGRANAVRVENRENSLTGLEHVPLILENGFPDWDAGGNAGGDLALIAVFARNGSSRCVGIVKDLGLRRGAYAASFTHDSHNLVAAGRDPADLALAANETLRQGGGLVVVENGRAAARLVLPVFGLLSDAPFESVARDLEAVEEALCRLGMTRRRPFLMLSLLTLSVSPYYKITDRGIVDTEGRRLLPAFEGDA